MLVSKRICPTKCRMSQLFSHSFLLRLHHIVYLHLVRYLLHPHTWEVMQLSLGSLYRCWEVRPMWWFLSQVQYLHQLSWVSTGFLCRKRILWECCSSSSHDHLCEYCLGNFGRYYRYVSNYLGYFIFRFFKIRTLRYINSPYQQI